MLRNIKSLHWNSYICIGRFSAARDDDDVNQTMNMLARDLTRVGIDYAIMGGNALRAHGYSRTTMDVDVLVAKGGKKLFADNLIGCGYAPRFPNAKASFMNTIFRIPIDLVEAGGYPGDGNPQSISFPNPDESSFSIMNRYGNEVKYLRLFVLIQLKLASYQSLPKQRIRDRLDVIELIKVTNLSEESVTKLDCSVRETFLECYQQAIEEAEELK